MRKKLKSFLSMSDTPVTYMGPWELREYVQKKWTKFVKATKRIKGASK